MSTRGTMSRAPGWCGCFAAAGLGALLLAPPAWAQARTGADLKLPEPMGVGESDGNLAQARAELKELEAQLAQKRAEMDALAAKVERLRAKLAPAAPEMRFEFQPGMRFIFAPEPGQESNSPALPGLPGKLLSRRGEGPAPSNPDAGKITIRIEGTLQLSCAAPAPKRQAEIIIIPEVGKPATPPAHGDKRMEELRQKLKSTLEEMEKLRRERKPDAPNPSDQTSSAPAAAEEIFEAGHYEQALAAFDAVARRHARDVVGVRAMAEGVRCLAALGRQEEMGRRLEEIKDRLGVVPAASRPEWEAWLTAADQSYSP